MRKELVFWPSPTLKMKSEEVRDTDCQKTYEIFGDMLDTMKHHNGAGLAAIQIGIPLRMIVLNAGEGYEFFQNPRIVSVEGTRKTMAEGCLSLPGVTECALRAPIVNVEALDRHGRPVTVRAEGFRAQALQHEIEHLDGILFIDSLGPGVKDRARAAMRRAALQGRVRR